MSSTMTKATHEHRWKQSYRDRQRVRRAFNRLDADDFLKLERVANFFIALYRLGPLYESKDLLNDTFKAVLNGDQKWPEETKVANNEKQNS